MKLFKNSIKSLTCLGIFVALHICVVRSESNCDDNSRLQYEAGKSYVYQVDIDSYDSTKENYFRMRSNSIKDPFSPRVRGLLSTKGKVVLSALPNCEFILTLKDLQSGTNGDRYDEEILGAGTTYFITRTSVKFSFRNGEVSKLFKDSNDASPWTVNIARGILTILQNKGLSNTDDEPTEPETNIRGDCMARLYSPKTDVYNKIIDIGQCSDPAISPKEGVPYSNPMFPPNHQSFRHSASLLCTHKIKDNLISSVNCSETMMVNMPLRPRFHNMETFSKLELEQTGVQASDVQGATEEEIAQLTEETSIAYDASINRPDESWKNNIIQEVTMLVNLMYTDIEANKAELYLQLKEKLTYITDFKELEEKLERDSTEDELLSQFVINMVREAASEIRTNAAMTYVGELILAGKMSDEAIAVFYTRLPFIKDATIAGLKVLFKVVEAEAIKFQSVFFPTIKFMSTKPIRQLSLGASGYAYSYCRIHADCGNHVEYVNLVNQIAQFATDEKPEHMSVAALHALGNLPVLPAYAVTVIKDVIGGRNGLVIGNSKKLTAFSAFRRFPCQPDLKKLTREILQKTKNVIEMRIEAYLAASRCLDQEDLTVIDNILQTEFANPLSGFIATHVHNLMDSQSPSKRYIQQSLLSQIEIPESTQPVFNKSMHSKCLEHSYFNPESDLGVSVDGCVLFDKKGASIPSFGNFNLTLDLHGKSYNSFEIGISRRYIRTMDKFPLKTFGNRLPASWAIKLLPAFFGIDSFYRIFGTTISMGIDLRDTWKSHQFVDKKENSENNSFQLQFVKPMTLLDHEVTLPTVSGFPLTFTTQAAYLPMVSVNHTGDTSGIGLWNLFTTTESFNHTSKSDSSFMSGVDISLGKGTPARMGYATKFKVNCNHTIGFVTTKTAENSIEKKVEFPEMIVWSKRITATKQFFVEHNGRLTTAWDVFSKGASADMTPKKFLELEAMGLRLSGQLLSHPSPSAPSALRDISFTLEKTEEQFTGYILDIISGEPNDNLWAMDMKLMAAGLSTEDALEMRMDYNHQSVQELKNEDDRPNFGLTVFATTSNLHRKPTGFQLQYKSLGFPKSVLSNHGWTKDETSVPSMLSKITHHVSRNSYEFKFDILRAGQVLTLMDWILTNNLHDVGINMKFGGPLKNSIGLIQGQFLYEPKYDAHQQQHHHRHHHLIRHHWHSKSLSELKLQSNLQLESEYLGRNVLTTDFHFVNHSVSWNTTVEVKGATYNILKTSPGPKHSLEHYENGNLKEKVTEWFAKTEYKDSWGSEATLSKTYRDTWTGFENDKDLTSTLSNVSVRLNTNCKSEPFIVEYTHSRDYIDGLALSKLKRSTVSLFVNEFAVNEGQILHDTNITETELVSGEEFKCKGYLIRPRSYGHKSFNPDQHKFRCLYHVDRLEMIFSQDFEFVVNHEINSLERTLDAFAYLPKHGQQINITFNGVEAAEMRYISTFHLENIPEHGINWNGISETAMNLDDRTLTINSNLTEDNQGGTYLWTTAVQSHWAENVFNGESKMKIIHEEPTKTINTVDILNVAKQEDKLTNTLTAVLSTNGETKIATPQHQLTWVYVHDDKMTEEEKAQYKYKIDTSSDIKYDILSQQNPHEVFRRKEGFHFHQLLDQSVYVGNGWVSLEVEDKELAGAMYSFSLDQASATIRPSTNFSFDVSGWFQQEMHEVRNNTYSGHYGFELIPSQILLAQNYNFHYKKVDQLDGDVMTSVEGEGDTKVVFEDLCHFSHYDKFGIKIDGKAYSNMRDLRLNGTHVTIIVKNEDDQNPWVVDVSGGLYKERHQHKLNWKSKSGHTDSRYQHQVTHGPIIPYSNFNVTISRRR